MIRYIKENPHCHKCEHCENKHLIDDLNGKLDKYFCTLSYRIAKHISDLDIHVTKEKKDYWDAKAEQSSVDALDDNIKNALDELNQFKDAFGDLNDFVKRGDLEGFATNDFVKTYVESVIKGYATKEYVNNQIKNWFDKSNYYTKSQVDSLLNKSYSDYSITSLDYANGILTIKQNNIGNTKSVNIGTSGDVPGGGSISQEAFDDMLKASKTIHTLNINNKSYNPVVSDVNMTITGGGISEGGGYYKPYFKNTTYYDSFPRSEMPTDGSAPKSDSGWSEQQKNPNSGQYTWMTYVFIDAAGNYGSYMDAIRITGEGSTGQTFNGSPLRIVGEWVRGKKYYDGRRDAENCIFYQDVVLYNNMYYVCTDTDSGEENHWALLPDRAEYWGKFTVTENFVADKIIANQAYIKELSSEEVVVMDNDAIVAGMTSSKAVDSKSDLNGKVTNKGDVRIWAGKMQTNGDLTTAYTTIDSNGSIVMQNIQQGKSIKLNPQECSFKIIGPVSVVDSSYIPSSDERIELVNFEYDVDGDTRNSTIRLVMKSENGRITIDPGAKEIYIYGGQDGIQSTMIGDESILMRDSNDDLYIGLDGTDIAGSDFVTLTSRYNKKGLHLCRGTEKYINNIIYTLEGLPTTDPHIEGALWVDNDRTLKVSSRVVGS